MTHYVTTDLTRDDHMPRRPSLAPTARLHRCDGQAQADVVAERHHLRRLDHGLPPSQKITTIAVNTGRWSRAVPADQPTAEIAEDMNIEPGDLRRSPGRLSPDGGLQDMLRLAPGISITTAITVGSEPCFEVPNPAHPSAYYVAATHHSGRVIEEYTGYSTLDDAIDAALGMADPAMLVRSPASGEIDGWQYSWAGPWAASEAEALAVSNSIHEEDMDADMRAELQSIRATPVPLLYSRRFPLHTAAQQGNTAEITRLVAEGADPNARDEKGWAPLHEVAGGETPLHAATRGGHTDAIATLLELGADLHARDAYGETPLHKAAWNGDPETIRALIELGAQLNAQDGFGDTPLHIVAENDRDGSLTRILAQAGADLDAVDKHDLTPLHRAARGNNPAAARALIEAGADPDARDEDGQTPLDLAKTRVTQHPPTIEALEAATNPPATPAASTTPETDSPSTPSM